MTRHGLTIPRPAAHRLREIRTRAPRANPTDAKQPEPTLPCRDGMHHPPVTRRITLPSSSIADPEAEPESQIPIAIA